MALVTTKRHSYASIKDTNSSEYAHMKQLNALQDKFSWERFRNSPGMRKRIKAAVNSYPNRNHKPV